jgi:PIN domain nuclease of toxin-antitoxin system
VRRLLLDTHALYWWLGSERRVGEAAAEALSDNANTIYFSPINGYEIALKAWLGKLEVDEELLDNFAGEAGSRGLQELPLTTDHAVRAARLDFDHRDPFDRILIAQALTEDLELVSNEAIFDRTGVKRIWA